MLVTMFRTFDAATVRRVEPKPYPTSPEPSEICPGRAEPSCRRLLVLALALALAGLGLRLGGRLCLLRGRGARRRADAVATGTAPAPDPSPSAPPAGDSSRQQRTARPRPARTPPSGCRDAPVRGIATGCRGPAAPRRRGPEGGSTDGGGSITSTESTTIERGGAAGWATGTGITDVAASGSTAAPSAASASRSATAFGYRSAGSVAIA